MNYGADINEIQLQTVTQATYTHTFYFVYLLCVKARLEWWIQKLKMRRNFTELKLNDHSLP